MQLTTREAVEAALICMESIATDVYKGDKQAGARKKIIASMQLLCEHYGFKLEQFFDVEVAE